MKLDDRPVRESEQQTAQIHFSQNKKWSRFQNLDRAENGSQPQEKPRYKNDRAEYVKKVFWVLNQIWPWFFLIFEFGSQIFSFAKKLFLIVLTGRDKNSNELEKYQEKSKLIFIGIPKYSGFSGAL